MPGHGANPLEPRARFPRTRTAVVHSTHVRAPRFTCPQIFGIQITRFMVMELIAAALRDPGDGAGRAAHCCGPREPRQVHQHDRGHAPVHPRRRGPAGDRRPWSRSVPAVSLDDLLLRAVQQPAGHDSRVRLGHGQHQRDRRPGPDDAGHGDRRGGPGAGLRGLLGGDRPSSRRAGPSSNRFSGA